MDESVLQKKGGEKDCVFAVITRNGKILLGLRNYTRDKWKDISVWTCSGGRCESGETFEAALRREVKEEIGIDDLRITGFLGTVPGAKEGDVTHFFSAETKAEPKLMEPEKFSSWRWVPFAEYESGELGIFNPPARELIIKYIRSTT